MKVRLEGAQKKDSAFGKDTRTNAPNTAMQAVRQGAQSGLTQQRGLAAMFAAATGVFRTQGLAGFYTGYVPNILQVRKTASCPMMSEEFIQPFRHKH